MARHATPLDASISDGTAGAGSRGFALASSGWSSAVTRSSTGALTVPARRAATAPPSLGALKLLASGTSTPGLGATTQLLAFAHPGGVTVWTRSPTPLTIAVSTSYGQPVRVWKTLVRGELVGTVLVTGRRYGYCFSQPVGGGYAPTRGCGTLVEHEYLNGAQLPDGAGINTLFDYANEPTPP
jgi:hypothetical protein